MFIREGGGASSCVVAGFLGPHAGKVIKDNIIVWAPVLQGARGVRHGSCFGCIWRRLLGCSGHQRSDIEQYLGIYTGISGVCVVTVEQVCFLRDALQTLIETGFPAVFCHLHYIVFCGE